MLYIVQIYEQHMQLMIHLIMSFFPFYYMIRLEFEENEKKRLAKEAAYAEAEREHVQVHHNTQYLRSR